MFKHFSYIHEIFLKVALTTINQTKQAIFMMKRRLETKKNLTPWAKFSLTQKNKDMYYIIGSENFTLQWTTNEHPKQVHYELLQAVTYI